MKDTIAGTMLVRPPIQERKPKRRPSNAATFAERSLCEALTCLGTLPPASNYIPNNVKAVTEAQWRKYAYERGISAGEDRAKERAFQRGTSKLVADGIVGTWQGFYWLT